MMLTKFVRAQLIIFSILTVIGVVVMATVYVQLPAMFGIGRYDVTVDLDATGGLYPHANVAYRGTNVGRVTEVRLTPDGVQAKLSIDSGYKIPMDSIAYVKSVSAVGEQYVDFVPNSGNGPDLADGDVVPVQNTRLPQDVGQMLDRADQLVAGIADTRLRTLVDAAFKAFNGAGPDLQKLLDSARLLLQEANKNSDQTKQLIEQIGPLLDTQNESADAVRQWTADLAKFTDQLRTSDPQLRSIIEKGPGATTEATKLFQDLRPTLPILLRNLVSVGQVAEIYNPGIEQILVIYPPLVAALLTAVRGPLDEGAIVDFMLQLNDPPGCTTGFTPWNQWRSPSDMTPVKTPPNLYCQVPQNAPEVVRGARNTPCMEAPGKRAATVEQCKSPEGYVPTGSNPPFGPQQWPRPARTTAPSAYHGDQSGPAPPATVPYDPATGTFAGPDGKIYRQPGLAPGGAPKPAPTWQTMMTEQQGI
ncbi:MCE family protein [Skermania sp. ID1734]|uniref:MCE family protein n=1 Tax=Skermania sp. ID1734 TaxID=2597516 RepID=UPI00117EEC43|nr:MlaD family protein [Skermania sp. ID1734]TSD96513.1 MCE family protein [Skermania sp. ID1734]